MTDVQQEDTCRFGAVPWRPRRDPRRRGFVHAQGSGAGDISARVLPTTGTAANVRIIGAGERCPAGTPVNWNAQGPAGPPGTTAEVSPQDVAVAL
jgi:hypothetical protein